MWSLLEPHSTMDATSDAELARLMQLEFDRETASEISQGERVYMYTH